MKEKFIDVIKNNDYSAINVQTLENISYQFPYFHLAKIFLLKKYQEENNFKLNFLLENLAANTTDRKILFNIKKNCEELNFVHHSVEKNEEKSEDEESSEKIHLIDKDQKLNFYQWIRLLCHKDFNPRKESSLSRIDIMEQLIKDNLKIKTLENSDFKNIDLHHHLNNDSFSKELMTETLAKTYLKQKKYKDAIAAYKILSLRYPEKNTSFDDQIKKIKFLQKNTPL